MSDNVKKSGEVSQIPVTGISAVPDLSVYSGSSAYISAMVLPSEASDKRITYTSSNSAVAEVDLNSGRVTGNNLGTATIVSRTIEGNFTANTIVTVEKAPIRITGITITPATLDLAPGQTAQLTATIAPFNADNKSVTWSSNNTSIATVDATGKVTAMGSGSATITARTVDGGKISTCIITSRIRVTGISLDQSSVNLTYPASTSLIVTVLPMEATNKTVSWTSSDNSVAVVSSTGKVTAVGGGNCNIIATSADGGFEASCSLSVIMPVTEVKFGFASPLSLNENTGHLKLSYTIIPEKASNKNVFITSSDPLVVEVEEYNDGALWLNPGKDGQAILTIVSEDGNHNSSVQVLVNPEPSSILLNKYSMTLYMGRPGLALIPTVLPTNSYNKEVVWKSSNPAIAVVNSIGMVTPISTGECTITAESSVNPNAKISCLVTVEVLVTGISLDKSKLNLIGPLGTTGAVTATLEPVNASNTGVIWSSDNESIATVAGGIITSAGNGTCTITATSESGGFTANVSVATVITPSSITLNNQEVVLDINETVQLMPTVLPLEAIDKSVIWTTSDLNIASVNDGLVTPIQAGAATIKATTVNGLSDTCKILVTGIADKDLNITVGIGEECTITNYHEDGEIVSWSSADPTIATVDANGKIAGVSFGETVITAVIDGQSFNCNVTVNQPVVSVEIINELTMDIDDAATMLSWTVFPSDARDTTVLWSTSDSSVASVNEGVITPIGVGTATITVTTIDGGKTSSCLVSIVQEVESITLNSSVLSFILGALPQTLTATILPADSTDQSISWVSQDPSIATVDNSGNVSCIGAGRTTIIASTNNGLTATCDIIVGTTNVATGLSISESIGLVMGGEPEQLTWMVIPTDAAGQEVLWSIADPTVASVNDSGLVTALTPGETTITAISVDGGFTDTCRVNVVPQVTPKISSSGNHALLLDSNGTVYSKGCNADGKLGINSEEDLISDWVRVFTNAIDIAANFGASMAVKADHVLYGWGHLQCEIPTPVGGYGGNYHQSIFNSPKPIPIRENVKAIAIGNDKYSWIGTDDKVYIRGSQFGNSFYCGESQVPGLTGIRKIISGNSPYFLDDAGNVYNWYYGKPVRKLLSGVANISISNVNCIAMMQDGSCLEIKENTGEITVRSEVTGVRKWVQSYSCDMVLKEDGTIVVWGTNMYWQFPDGGPAGATSIPTPTVIPGLTDVIDFHSDDYFSTAITRSGKVYNWGRISCWPLADEMPNLVETQISTIPYAINPELIYLNKYKMNLCTNGITDQLFAKIIPSNADDLKVTWSVEDWKVATVDNHGVVTPRAVGSTYVIARTSNGLYAKCLIKVHTPVKPKIVSGYEHTLILKPNTEVIAYGCNIAGQVGCGDPNYGYEWPQIILDDVIDIAASNNASAAIRKDGTVWEWGRRTHWTASGTSPSGGGWSTQGYIVNSNIPVCSINLTVLDNDPAIKVHAMFDSILVQTASGRVWGDGYETTGTSGFIPVPDQERSDSNWKRGWNTWTDVKEIFGAFDNSFVIKNDGTTWVYGKNYTTVGGYNGTGYTGGAPLDIHGTQITTVANITKILPAGGLNNTIFINNDGEAFFYDGVKIELPVKVLDGIVGGARSTAYAFLIDENNEIWVIGDNSDYQLGTEYTTSVFTKAENLGKFIDIAAGRYLAGGVRADGSIWHWGSYGCKHIGAPTQLVNEDGSECFIPGWPISSASVILNKHEIDLVIGWNTEDLNATVLPVNATNKEVTWISDNESVATVDDNGLVTPVSAGTCNVIAITDDHTHRDTCKVNVGTFVNTTGITSEVIAVYLTELGKTYKLNLNVLPANATNKAVTWTLGDPAIASISDDGTITAIGEGSTTITATTVNGGHSIVVNVIVDVAEAISYLGIETNPDPVEVPSGLGIKLPPYASLTIKDVQLDWTRKDVLIYERVGNIVLGWWKNVIPVESVHYSIERQAMIEDTYEWRGPLVGQNGTRISGQLKISDRPTTGIIQYEYPNLDPGSITNVKVKAANNDMVVVYTDEHDYIWGYVTGWYDGCHNPYNYPWMVRVTGDLGLQHYDFEVGPFRSQITMCGQPHKVTANPLLDFIEDSIKEKLKELYPDAILNIHEFEHLKLEPQVPDDVHWKFDETNRLMVWTDRQTYFDNPGEIDLTLFETTLVVNNENTMAAPVLPTPLALDDLLKNYIENTPVYFPNMHPISYSVAVTSGNEWARKMVEVDYEQPDVVGRVWTPKDNPVRIWYKGDGIFEGHVLDHTFSTYNELGLPVVAFSRKDINLANDEGIEYDGICNIKWTAIVKENNGIASLSWAANKAEELILPSYSTHGSIFLRDFTPMTQTILTGSSLAPREDIYVVEDTVPHPWSAATLYRVAITQRNVSAKVLTSETDATIPLKRPDPNLRWRFVQGNESIIAYIECVRTIRSSSIESDLKIAPVNGHEPFERDGDGWQPFNGSCDAPDPPAEWFDISYGIAFYSSQMNVSWNWDYYPEAKGMALPVNHEPFTLMCQATRYKVSESTGSVSETIVKTIEPNTNCEYQPGIPGGNPGGGGSGGGGGTGGDGGGGGGSPTIPSPGGLVVPRAPWAPINDEAEGTWPWIEDWIKIRIPKGEGEDPDINLVPSDPNMEFEIIPIHSDDPNYKDYRVSVNALIPELGRWNPLIKCGYYYLGSDEYYLYVDNKPETRPFEIEKFDTINTSIDIYFETTSYKEEGDQVIIQGELNFEKGQFSGGAKLDKEKHAIVLTKFVDSDNWQAGTYTSPWIKVDPSMIEWRTLEATGYLPMGSVRVEARTNIDNVVTPWVGVMNGEAPQIPVGSLIQYRLSLKQGTIEMPGAFSITWNTKEQFDQCEVENVLFTVVEDESYLTARESNQNFVITSPVLSSNNAEGYDISRWDTVIVDAYISQGAELEIYTCSAQTPEGPWDYWVKIEPGKSMSNGQAPYIKWRIVGRKGLGKIAPIVDSVKLNAIVKEEATVPPIIANMKMVLHRPEGETPVEVGLTKAVSFTADGTFHAVTNQTIREIVENYLVSSGLDFNMDNIDSFGVSGPPGTKFSYRTDGLDQIKAASEEPKLIKAMTNTSFRLDTNNEVEIWPVPKQGAPVIVYDDRSEALRQVFFTDEAGRPTLMNTEVIEGDGTNRVDLAHMGIDPNSLSVYLDETGLDQWKEVTISDVVFYDSIIWLPFTLGDNQRVKIHYSLVGSFYVDYNYKTEFALGKIKVYDPQVNDKREIRVNYETNNWSSYYKADEVNLNPLMSVEEGRFLFISDKVPVPKDIEIRCMPDTLIGNGADQTTLYAIVKDEQGNQVPYEPVTFSITTGSGSLTTPGTETNYNGVATTRYLVPKETITAEQEVTIEVRTKDLQINKVIKLVPEVASGQLVISGSDILDEKNRMTAITFNALDNQYKPLIGTLLVKVDGVEQIVQLVEGKATVSIYYDSIIAKGRRLLVEALKDNLSASFVIFVD